VLLAVIPLSEKRRDHPARTVQRLREAARAVVRRQKERPAGPEDAGELAHTGSGIEQVLEDLDRGDEVELGVAEREPLEVAADELGVDARGRGLRRGEDAVRDVDADDPPRDGTERRQRRQKAPVSAAGVEERLRREQRADLFAQHRELAVERRVGNNRLRVVRAAPLVDLAQRVRGREVDVRHTRTQAGRVARDSGLRGREADAITLLA
jgi:hypothetical protein